MASKGVPSNIIHFGSLRYRVTGTGELRTTLRSLQDVDNAILVPLELEDRTDKEPTILSNFMKQRAQADIRTVDIDEVFLMSKIVVYVKQTYTQYHL